MDKMREEFEEWVSECAPIKAEFKDGSYNDAMIEMTWIVWQASRKALVVELPVAFPVCDDNDSAEVAYVLDILEKLALAGVSYK